MPEVWYTIKLISYEKKQSGHNMMNFKIIILRKANRMLKGILYKLSFIYMEYKEDARPCMIQKLGKACGCQGSTVSPACRPRGPHSDDENSKTVLLQ